MSTIVSRNVADLPEVSRQGIEQVLGTTLKPNERVHIVVDAPAAGPAPLIRSQASKHIFAIISKAQANASNRGVTPEQFNEAIDEAMQHIRPRT